MDEEFRPQHRPRAYRLGRALSPATTKRAQVRGILEQLIDNELNPGRRDPVGAGAGHPARRQPGHRPAGHRRPGRGRRTGTGARQGHLRHRAAGRLPTAPDLLLPGDARPRTAAGHRGAVRARGAGRRRRRLRAPDPARPTGDPGRAAADRRRHPDGVRGWELPVDAVPGTAAARAGFALRRVRQRVRRGGDQRRADRPGRIGRRRSGPASWASPSGPRCWCRSGSPTPATG